MADRRVRGILSASLARLLGGGSSCAPGTGPGRPVGFELLGGHAHRSVAIGVRQARTPFLAVVVKVDQAAVALAVETGMPIWTTSGLPSVNLISSGFRRTARLLLATVGPALGIAARRRGGQRRGSCRHQRKDLRYAIASLCVPMSDAGVAYSQRMVGLLIDGLCYGAEVTFAKAPTVPKAAMLPNG